MNEDVYLVCKHDAGGYRVYVRPGSAATILPHDKLTATEAEFLAVHMNRAYHCGVDAGDIKRREAICEALGLT